MNFPKIKKLIGGFLVLALFTSSSALILSHYLTTRANSSGNQDKTADALNAFRPSSDLGSYSSGGQVDLTQQLANNIANKLIQDNPNGPQGTVGAQGIQVPKDLNQIVSDYVDQAINSSSSIPSFKVDEKRLIVRDKYSLQDLQNYLDSVQNILTAFSSSDFKNLESKLATGSDISTLGAASLFYSQLEDQFYALPVPRPFLKIHEDILSSLEIKRVVFGQNLDADPLKALLTFQSARNSLDDTVASITSDFQVFKLTWPITVKTLSQNNNFLINVAYAQGVPVLDYIVEIQTQAISSLNSDMDALQNQSWIMQVLTEYFKNKVLKKVVDAIINWANGGGGKSAYIGNWGSFLTKAYTDAAGQLLAADAQNFCSPYRVQLTQELQKLNGIRNLSLGSGGVGCSLDNTVSNLDAFYSDFSAGGWDGFTALSQNNYYATLYFENIKISQQAQNQQNAAQAQAIAGNGYTGTSGCADGSTPGEKKTYDADGYLVNYQASICADGSEPEITTPGKNISDLVSKGVGSSIDRIVNATDWEALSVQIGVMALDKLISAGSKGLLHGNVTSDSKLTAEEICAGYTDPAQKQSCIDSVNNMTNPTVAGSARSLLLSKIQKELEDTTSTVGYYSVAADTATSSLNMLQGIIDQKDLCPTTAAQAQSEYNSLNPEYADILTKLATAISKESAMEAFLGEVMGYTPETDSEYFATKLSDFQNTFGPIGTSAQESGDAQAEAQRMQDKLSAISTLLNSCVKP